MAVGIEVNEVATKYANMEERRSISNGLYISFSTRGRTSNTLNERPPLACVR